MKSFSMEINPGDIVTFIYKNYAGKVSKRTAKVLRFYWASNEYHPEPQFLMAGLDLDKAEPRGFAVKDISQLTVVSTARDNNYQPQSKFNLDEFLETEHVISYVDRGSDTIESTKFPQSGKKYAIRFQENKRKQGATIIRGIEE